MEVMEGKGLKEEGSTGGQARSELACGGREGGRVATAQRAGRKAARRASVGESEGGRTGGVRLRKRATTGQRVERVRCECGGVGKVKRRQAGG